MEPMTEIEPRIQLCEAISDARTHPFALCLVGEVSANANTHCKSATVTRRSWVRRTTVSPGFHTALSCGDAEPMTGIEPAYSAWEPAVARSGLFR